MNYPKKGALIRAARTIAATTIAAFFAAAVSATPVALEGTAFTVFAGAVTAVLLGADKYIRERLKEQPAVGGE